MNKKVVLLFFVVMLFSCERTQQEIIADTYTEWMGKQIKMPQNSVFTIDARDTVEVEYQDNYKIVMYVDSIGCLACHLGLKSWDRFATMVDSLTGGKVPTLIFVNVSQRKNIEKVLELHPYHRPICVDFKDEYNRLNNLSEYEMFRSFLLDEKNRVVLIGNPIRNTKVADLYLKTIKERLGLNDTMSIGIERPLIRLGQFNWRERQKVEYVLRNENKTELQIDTITTSCECTTATIDKEIIAAGDSAIISIEYRAEKAEAFMREVYLQTKEEEITITIEGEGV